jgi:putative transposase
MLCRLMHVSARGDMKVLAHIHEQNGLSLGSYGRPRMIIVIKEAGLDVGERRVTCLMRINGIKPVRTRKHKVTTTSNHRLGIEPNWLDGDFVADAPYQKWAGDITYYGLPRVGSTLPSFLICTVAASLVGRMEKDMAIRTLNMAANLRQPAEGWIFHSDRGSQYCAYDYQKKLQAYGLQPSMSGKGNCYDNASVETFFKGLKAEMIWRQKWQTRRQAETAIFQYISGFYNTRRRHSYLGGISPMAFEAKVA